MKATIAIAALVLAMLAACAPAAPQRCHRYDGISLNRENGFSASFDWKSPRTIDAPPEHIDVALTLVRPLRGPIELVHVLGDVETDRWLLSPPDQDNVASGICWITTPGLMPPVCGAVLQMLPYFPGGYYYLRANDNTVLEAGLAFYICD